MKFNFNSNTIVYKLNESEDFISIHLEHKIISFSMNDYYVVICVDWEHMNESENLYIYNLKGNLIFKIKEAPKSLYGRGYYSSVGFNTEHILLAQSFDFRYEIDLRTGEFISETYTK